MQAFAGERGRLCFPDPVVPDDDGLALLPYVPLRRETCIGEDGEEVNRCYATHRMISLLLLNLMLLLRWKQTGRSIWATSQLHEGRKHTVHYMLYHFDLGSGVD